MVLSEANEQYTNPVREVRLNERLVLLKDGGAHLRANVLVMLITRRDFDLSGREDGRLLLFAWSAGARDLRGISAASQNERVHWSHCSRGSRAGRSSCTGVPTDVLVTSTGVWVCRRTSCHDDLASGGINGLLASKIRVGTSEVFLPRRSA